MTELYAEVLRPPVKTPRLGFLGVGWIGRHRMQALLGAGLAEAAMICDPDEKCLAAAHQAAPSARVAQCLDDMLAADLDGIVIATPNQMHAEQTIAALCAGKAVFCQKPLARTQEECARVVEAARRSDRLLGVDFSYRHVRGIELMRQRLQQGALGRLFAMNLIFHNAYGPDKGWFRDVTLSGGGCMLDLGVHLVDLALWFNGGARPRHVCSHLFRGGMAMEHRGEVEDFAEALLHLDNGVSVSIACSWNLHAGQDAVIRVELHGTDGGATLGNVNGSFVDFVTEEYHGRERTVIAGPPEQWGGRAIAHWAARLVENPGFDPEAMRVAEVAGIIDRIYSGGGTYHDEQEPAFDEGTDDGGLRGRGVDVLADAGARAG